MTRDGKTIVLPKPTEIREKPAKPLIVDGGAISENQEISDFGPMSLAQLGENYQHILRAMAIYYPVAYQFIRELGQGRQGRVFLATRQGARGCITEHAIKLFDPAIYRSADEYWTDMGRIANQVSRLHRLHSPNMVAGYMYEETQGIGYLQMDTVDGLDIKRLLSKKVLEKARSRSTAREWKGFSRTIFRIEGDKVGIQPGVAVYILRGVLRGLERLHAVNFLHSDIKPANIMIDRLGGVKIVDFGRAVVSGEKLSFLLGSPLYMAPEIHRREAGRPQSDFYSLGLVAIEMLRGMPLTDSEVVPEEELLKMKISLPDKLEQSLPPHVQANAQLVHILRRFIEPDPEKRFASAKDADVGDFGLRIIDKQLVQAGLDSEYARDLSDYLAKLCDERTGCLEV